MAETYRQLDASAAAGMTTEASKAAQATAAWCVVGFLFSGVLAIINLPHATPDAANRESVLRRE